MAPTPLFNYTSTENWEPKDRSPVAVFQQFIMRIPFMFCQNGDCVRSLTKSFSKNQQKFYSLTFLLKIIKHLHGLNDPQKASFYILLNL